MLLVNSRERIEQLNKLKIALQAVLELRKKLEEQDIQEEQVGIVQNKTSKRQSFRRRTLKKMRRAGRRHKAQQVQVQQVQEEKDTITSKGTLKQEIEDFRKGKIKRISFYDRYLR